MRLRVMLIRLGYRPRDEAPSSALGQRTEEGAHVCLLATEPNWVKNRHNCLCMIQMRISPAGKGSLALIQWLFP